MVHTLSKSYRDVALNFQQSEFMVTQTQKKKNEEKTR